MLCVAGGLVCRNQHLLCDRVCCVVSGAAPVCGVVLWFVLVVDGGGGPPGSVPIPVAKPIHADGTAPGGVWESRLPPTRICQYILGCGVYPAWGRLWFWAGAPRTPFFACAGSFPVSRRGRRLLIVPRPDPRDSARADFQCWWP